MHAVVTGKVSREKARTLQKDAFTLVPASDLPPSITPSGADPHQPAAALPCQLQQQSALGRSGPQEQQQTSQPQADPHLHPGSQTHGQTSPQASISFGQWLQSPAEQMHRQPQTRANQQPQPQSQSQPTPQPLALGQPPAQPHEPQPLAQPSQALQSGQNRQEEHNPPEEGQQPGSGEPISGGIPADLPEAAPSRDFQNALQAANDVLRGVAATANGLSDEALRKWQSNVAEALNAKAPGLLAQTLKFLGSSDTNAKAAALPTLLWSSVECPEVAGLIALTQIRAGKAMSRRSAATQQQPQLQGAALEGPGPSADPLSQHVLQPRECPRPLQTPETSEDPTGQPPLETREDPQGQHPLPEEPQPQQRDHRGIDRVPRPLEDPRTDPCSETLEDPQPHQSPPLLEDPQPHREPHDEHLPEAPETHDDPQIARHTEPREDCTDRHVPQLLSDTHTKHVGQLSEARQTDADLRPSPEDVDVSQDPQPIGHTNGSDGAKQRDDMQFQGHCQAQEHPQPRDRPHPLAVHQKDLFGRALGGEGAMRGQMEEGAATQGKKHTRWWAESRPRKRIRVADGASRLAGQGGGDGGMSGLPFGSEAEEGEDVEGPDTLVPGFPAMGVGADQVGGESPSAAADHRGGCQQIPEEMDTAAEGRGGRCSSGNEAPVPLGLPEEAEVDLQESSSGRGDAQGLGLVAATDDVHSCHHPPQEEEAAAPQHASGKSPGRPLRGIAIHLLDDSSSDEEIDIM